VGKFFDSRAVYKIFEGPLGHTSVKSGTKITFLHETLVDKVKKYYPRAGQKNSAGRIWPAGRTLPTTAYKHSPKPKPTPKPPHPNKWGLYTLSPSLIKMLTLFHTPVGVLPFSPFYYRVYFGFQHFCSIWIIFDYFCSMVISIGWPVSLK